MTNQNYEKDFVSIIMPSYNSSKFIAESIQSVLDQTFRNWELLITDDKSNDTSVKIIQEFIQKDSRIKLFQSEKNLGAASARNVSLDYAKGQFIAFLDSDDLWIPTKLEMQIDRMKKERLPFTYSNYEVILEDGNSTGKIIKVPTQIDYRGYLRNTIIGCLTVVIDRCQVGDFRMPVIKSSHDMALWLLIMKRGYKAYAIKENLAKYRLVSTSNTAKKKKAALDVWKVYREIENLSIVYSAFNFMGYAFNAVKKRL